MIPDITKKRRLSNSTWLRGQILKLADEAERNALEDAERAETDGHQSNGSVSEARAETSQHYAKELRRILEGLTWDEALSQRIKESYR